MEYMRTITCGGYEEVVGLDIPVHNPARVAKIQGLEKHLHVGFDVRRRQHNGLVLDNCLQIAFHVLKYLHPLMHCGCILLGGASSSHLVCPA